MGYTKYSHKSYFLLFPCLILALSGLASAQGDSASDSESQGDRIERLVAQLGDDEFERRESAQAALRQIGPAARAALARARNHADFEIAWRARYLLERIQVEWVHKDDPPEVAKLFGRYEFLSDTEKIARIQLMQGQPDEVRAITLSRITRLETHEGLSKLAALALLGMDPWQIATITQPELESAVFHQQMAVQNQILLQMQAQQQIPVFGNMPGGMMPGMGLGMGLDPTEQAEPLAETSPGDQSPAKNLDRAALAALADKELQKCSRPAAEWIRAALHLDLDEDADKFLSTWRRLRAEEEKRTESDDEQPDRLGKAIVDQMLWYETDVLFRLNREEEALASARNLMEKAALGPDDLRRLVDWFGKHRQTGLLEELTEKRTAEFNRNPMLLYQVAEAFKESGEDAKADAVAKKALYLNPGSSTVSLAIHQEIAFTLYRRGAIEWAEREMQYVVDHAPTNGTAKLQMQIGLAQLQFEDERPLEAAQGLNKLLEVERMRGQDNPTLREYRAQCEYYFSQHYRKIGDRDKEREHLLKALETGAVQTGVLADLMIAAWRMEGLPDDVRKKVEARVEAMLAQDLREINAEPKDANNLNNYSWLCSNTKLGDVKKALEFSKKSVELEPDKYAYWDTLAHCHYAVGDLDNAVKCQEKAAEMAPYCKVITSKLDFFRKERDAAEKARPADAQPPANASPEVPNQGKTTP